MFNVHLGTIGARPLPPVSAPRYEVDVDKILTVRVFCALP